MIYMFLADGFEEVEAICPLDIMRRAGLEVTTVGIGSTEIRGAHGICVKADILDTEFDGKDMQMIFLPGGMPGTVNLQNSPIVINAVETAHKNKCFIAAICAAPSILGDMGLVENKAAVCYPGFEERLYGAVIVKDNVVRDDKLITARGMGVALDMGLKIVEIFCGKADAERLRHAIIAD